MFDCKIYFEKKHKKYCQLNFLVTGKLACESFKIISDLLKISKNLLIKSSNHEINSQANKMYNIND